MLEQSRGGFHFGVVLRLLKKIITPKILWNLKSTIYNNSVYREKKQDGCNIFLNCDQDNTKGEESGDNRNFCRISLRRK